MENVHCWEAINTCSTPPPNTAMHERGAETYASSSFLALPGPKSARAGPAIAPQARAATAMSVALHTKESHLVAFAFSTNER